jgi:FkbH-like protein
VSSLDLDQVLRAMPDERLVGLVLAGCAPEERLRRAERLLAALHGRSAEAQGAREALARGLRGLVREAPAALRAWADAQRTGSPAADWVCARLYSSLGEPLRAGEAWDAVIEREFGSRVERHLARGRLRLDAGEWSGAAADLREAFREPTGHRELERGARLLAKLRRSGEPLPAKRRVKLALLGGSTTQLMRPLLEMVCFRDHIDAEIYEAEYGLFRQEVLDRSSGLHRFAPDVVLIATHWRDAQLPPLSEDADAAVESLVSGFASLWEICRGELRAHVIQHSFDPPPNESYGALGRNLEGGRARLLARANLELLARAGSGVSILDLDGVAARCGAAAWDAPGLWYLAKQHPAPEALGGWADAVAAQLRAVFGLGKKVLALDLDNTLWGGVIGEDRLEGIRLGAHSPEGEAHLDLQRYARELRERGVVLVVCSKNNEADAREPFEAHPEMLLRLDDFAVFRANWQDKATNLREIAAALDLGLDSFVFVDDNPTERAWVRRALPEVAVPEIGDDVAHYVRILDRGRWFEALTLSEEDRLRSADYAANAHRAALASGAGSMDEFLASLEMTATIGRFDPPNLPRITQLVNKSNQFNLTTRRYTQEQLQAFAESTRHVTRWFRLRDRFGDNGLIGVMIGVEDAEASTLEIDLWLMSCRVLGRRMEELMCGTLLEEARARGLSRLVGRYLPTEKNGLVADLYPRLGFKDAGAGGTSGETVWEYDVEQQPRILCPSIRVEAPGSRGRESHG